MITKEQLLAAAKASAAYNAPIRPITGAVAAGVAAQFEKGEPKWWASVADGWKNRYFPSPDAALYNLVTCLHFEALSRHELALEVAAQLPSCGGAPTKELGPVVMEYLNGPAPRFVQNLAHRSPRSFNFFSGSQWHYYAGAFFARRKMPYYVVELGSPGGLGACCDVLTSGATGFMRSLVEARVGVDDTVLDVRKDDDVQWLLASELPDETDSIKTTARTANALRKALAKDPQFLELIPCPAPLGPSVIAKNIPPEEDIGLLVISTRVRAGLAPDQVRPWVSAMRALLTPWKDRSLWVDFETDSAKAEIFLHRDRDGQTASMRALGMTGSRDDTTFQADIPAIKAFLS